MALKKGHNFNFLGFTLPLFKTNFTFLIVAPPPHTHIGQFYPKRRNNAKCLKNQKKVRSTLIDALMCRKT